MCLNILPGGDSFAHKLDTKTDILEQILEEAHPMKGDETRVINLHIPFLRNFEGESIIHLLAYDQDFRAINMCLEYL